LLTLLLEPFHVASRKNFEKRLEKKAVAADIEADPLANDDKPEQQELPEWIPPTYTGGKFD
jgi:hypothetical protein